MVWFEFASKLQKKKKKSHKQNILLYYDSTHYFINRK
jgi:hypothetical protein